MESIGNRIEIILKTLGYKKVTFAERLKIDQSYVSRLVSEKGLPSERLIESICREFGINRAWLETGEGEMMAETQSRTLDRIAARYGKSEVLRSVLDVYANLTDDEQDAVDRYIRLCAAAIANDQVPNAAAAETSESLEAGAIGAVRESEPERASAAE
nr:MAG TPA: hypothetical protein [Caudoviricetes sp.]